MEISIVKTMQEIPSGLLIVPLLISAVSSTLFPDFWKTLGDPSEGLLKSSTYCIIGLMLFPNGATISARKLGYILKYGVTYAIFKLFVISGAGTLFLYLLGVDDSWDISAFVFIPAIYYMGPGLFVILAQQCGEPKDTGMTLLPQLPYTFVWPILVFNLSDGADADWMSAVNVLIPFFLSMLLRNLDPGFTKFIKPASTICLMLMSFVFGAAINLKITFHTRLRGIILSIIMLLTNLLFMYLLADKIILKRSGWFGAGLCAITGVVCVDPPLTVAGNEACAAYISEAISFPALIFLITTLICVVMCRVISSKSKKEAGQAS